MTEGKQCAGESFIHAQRCKPVGSTESYIKSIVYIFTQTLRGRAAEARQPHKLNVVGSNPTLRNQKVQLFN